jgi:leukotriene-A4 hydrolase
MIVFLEAVQLFDTPLTPTQSRLLGHTYSLISTKNAEVSACYLSIGLAAKDEEVYPLTANFLGRVGRMKFVRPLYSQLATCDRKLAEETFEKNKGFYHPICRSMVEKDLRGSK